MCIRDRIEGITLSTVLVDQNVLSDPLSTFELILREGDPLVVLQSAKEWLARCTRISLRGLVTSSKSREAAEAFWGHRAFANHRLILVYGLLSLRCHHCIYP